MKSASFAGLTLCLLAAASALPGAEAEPPVHLRGIVSVSGRPLALLETSAKPPSQREMTLARGQRDGDIEVMEIDPMAGKVNINRAGTPMNLTFADLPPGHLVPHVTGGANTGFLSEPASIRLQQIHLHQVFSLYQRLAQRTLIRPEPLPEFRLDISSTNPVTTGDVIRSIEQVLAERGLFFQPDGDKFVIAGDRETAGKITAQVREAAAHLAQRPGPSSPAATGHAGASAPASSAAGEEQLPAGVINFMGTDLIQVLTVLQELADRTLLCPSALPARSIVLQTCTPMTRPEAIYAFAAVLAVNDISALPVGDKFVFAFPSAEAAKATTLLARKPLPSGTAQSTLPAGSIHLLGADLEQVIGLYEKLSGRAVVIEPGLPQPRLVLRNQSVLTRDEVLYALDLFLGWSGLAVVPQADGKTAKLVRSEETKTKP